ASHGALPLLGTRAAARNSPSIPLIGSRAGWLAWLLGSAADTACTSEAIHCRNSQEDFNMQPKASARWQGTVKEGKGTISTQSGVLSDAPYGFNARFGDGKGTNPEELLGAAHAGC